MTSAAVPAADGITTVNPATGTALHTYPASGDAGIDAAIAASAAAQRDWARLDLDAPGAVLTRAAAVLRRRVAALALLITREMGKPLTESRAEVEKCAWACEYYAEHAADFLADEHVVTGADRSWISYEPVGLVLAVMPWNFPLWQVFWFAAPALMAGNGALLKHSPNTTGCALAVVDVLAEAGAPDGLFAALVVPEADVPATVARVIGDRRIGAVTVTGSERAGIGVAVAAGRAVKKSVLELGGRPHRRRSGTGRHRGRAAGPYRPRRGHRATGAGVGRVDEAVRVANDTPFGLAASVWTADPDRGVAVGRRIVSGALFINEVVASDVRLPFGGTRRSGYGRELAQAGIREFVNTRTFVLRDQPPAVAPAAE